MISLPWHPHCDILKEIGERERTTLKTTNSWENKSFILFYNTDRKENKKIVGTHKQQGDLLNF
jgi:hypothetical protein